MSKKVNGKSANCQACGIITVMGKYLNSPSTSYEVFDGIRYRRFCSKDHAQLVTRRQDTANVQNVYGVSPRHAVFEAKTGNGPIQAEKRS